MFFEGDDFDQQFVRAQTRASYLASAPAARPGRSQGHRGSKPLPGRRFAHSGRPAPRGPCGPMHPSGWYASPTTDGRNLSSAQVPANGRFQIAIAQGCGQRRFAFQHGLPFAQDDRERRRRSFRAGSRASPAHDRAPGPCAAPRLQMQEHEPREVDRRRAAGIGAGQGAGHPGLRSASALVLSEPTFKMPPSTWSLISKLRR